VMCWMGRKPMLYYSCSDKYFALTKDLLGFENLTGLTALIFLKGYIW